MPDDHDDEPKPAPPEPKADWFTECRDLHGLTCGGSWKHHNQMLIDEARAARARTHDERKP